MLITDQDRPPSGPHPQAQDSPPPAGGLEGRSIGRQGEGQAPELQEYKKKRIRALE
jgi:hypothetical protein